MKEIYNTYVENNFRKTTQAKFKFKQFEYNYKKFFPEDKNSSLLDIGIGRGEMLTCFKDWGYKNYLGIDISPSTIKFCKNLDLKCELVEDSSAFLCNHKEKYDVITLIDVLEHIDRDKVLEILKDIKGSLKESGILIIQIPNMQAPDSNQYMYIDFTHINGFTENSLIQILSVVGFSKISFQPFETYCSFSVKAIVGKFLRKIYWFYVKYKRKLNGGFGSCILSPVFSVIVKK